MAKGRLEHANISVTDPERSAALLTELLGWKERWRGPSLKYGRSVHIGAEHDYIALYTGDHVKGRVRQGPPAQPYRLHCRRPQCGGENRGRTRARTLRA